MAKLTYSSRTKLIIRTGQQITLGKPINKGGEGEIWTVVEYPDSVAKLYFEYEVEREQKMAAMIKNPPADSMRSKKHISIAWPTASLYNRTDHFAGYLMPFISQSPTVFHAYHPRMQAKKFPHFDVRYLLRTAQNISIALDALHKCGHVMGDVNESNILVTDKALVTLIDTDSFQIQERAGRSFRCRVGTDRFTPPELQGIDFSTIDRKPEHDSFGLGILIFQLLMSGRYPFDGVPISPNHSDGRIDLYFSKKGIFPFSDASIEASPPPNAPSFNVLHPEIKNLFEKCFITGQGFPRLRPKPSEWKSALAQAEDDLIQCKRDESHWYFKHLGRNCPQCEQVSSTHHKTKNTQYTSPLFAQKPLETNFSNPARASNVPSTYPNRARVRPLPTKPSFWNNLSQNQILLVTIGGLLIGLASALLTVILKNYAVNIGGATGFIAGGIAVLILLGIGWVIYSEVEGCAWAGCLVMLFGVFSFTSVSGAVSWYITQSIEQNIVIYSTSLLYFWRALLGSLLGLALGSALVAYKDREYPRLSGYITLFIAICIVGYYVFPYTLQLARAFQPEINPPIPISPILAPFSPADPVLEPSPTPSLSNDIPILPETEALCREIYRAKENDLLSTVAQEYLGNITRFDLIVDATNKAHELDPTFSKIDDPNQLEIGDKICIPR